MLLWIALPYVSITAFIVGLLWRYRFDKFNWTSRSSQLYEGRLLRFAGPLFHIGLFAVIGGHVVGLLIPQSFTETVGITQEMYHFGAIYMGGAAGVATITGIALLIYRRRSTAMVFAQTTKNDKIMYIFLVSTLLAGSAATMSSAGIIGSEHNYRETVSPWLRSILSFNPQPELVMAAPLAFRIHIIIALLLFLIWPFTRLVHALSAPVGYLFRPAILYRTKGSGNTGGNRKPKPGWERIKY